MKTIIFNFEKLKEEHLSQKNTQKKQLIFECQQEILQTEEQIRNLITQINQLQSNIDMNYKIIAQINKD